LGQELQDFGLLLKRLRKANRLTQGEFGKAIGYSQPSVSSYESGDSEPGYLFLLKLRRTFGYDLFAENIGKVIFEKTYDKAARAPIKKEPGLLVPDPNLLIQVEKQITDAMLNLRQALDALDFYPEEENTDQDAAFQVLPLGKNPKSGKR